MGSILRYAVQLLMRAGSPGGSFPWSTFAVNIAGSFLIGFFYALSARLNLNAEVRMFLTVGLCGGFTTFSTFSNESLALLKAQQWALFALYAGLSVLVGIVMVFCGNITAKWLS